MTHRKFGLYIRLGTEVRNLIVSGLAEKLKKNGEIVIITHYKSELLNQLAKKYDLRQEYLPTEKYLRRSRLKIEGYFLSSRRSRLRLKGIKTFKLLKNSPDLSGKDYLKGNYLVYTLFRLITLKFINKNYFINELGDYLIKNKYTDVVMQSYYAPEQMSMGVTANRIGCKVWMTTWSWKEFYINEFIPFQPNGLFVWSKKLKELYARFNTHIDNRAIIPVGNLSYDPFHNYKPCRSVDYYASKYGFTIEQSLILYTLVNPVVYKNEHLIIQKIIKALKIAFIDPPVLLLKPNPMDTTAGRFDFVEQEKNVVMLDNLWEYDKEANFNTVSEEGNIEWMDLLYYAKMNISIPSTVTIEALLMNIPVINIGFDEKGSKNTSIQYLGKAFFYKDLFTRNDVKLASNIEELIFLIKHFENEEPAISSLEEYLINSGTATEEAAKFIIKNKLCI